MKLFLLLLFFVLSSCNTFYLGSHKHKEINYTTIDNYQLAGDIYLPKIVLKKNPMVIVIHGGGWRSRSGDMSVICEQIAENNMIALNITYRLAPQFHYPVQSEDVKSVMKWIHENAPKYNIDTDNIFVWGYSAGAHLAFNLANEKDIKIKAIVVGGIPAYLPAYPNSDMITDFVGKKYAENHELWEQASPANHVSTQTPPTFIYHGELDTLVDISQAELLEKKLIENKVSYEFYRVSVMGHFAVYLFSEESIDRGIKFIKKQL